MKLTRTSELTGRTRSQELPITYDQYLEYMLGTGDIQYVLPELNPDQREFLKTGIVPEELAPPKHKKPVSSSPTGH